MQITSATAKQISFIRDLAAKAKTTDGNVAWARSGFGDYAETRELSGEIRTSHGSSSVAAYNQIVWKVEWMMDMVDSGEVLMSQAVASQIIEALKEPMVRKIAGITYECGVRLNDGTLGQVMAVHALKGEQVLDACYTAIHVNFPRAIANKIIPSKE